MTDSLQDVVVDGRYVVWVAEVFPDWTTLQITATGDAFAFNRETGQVYKIPDPNCPFLQWPNSAALSPGRSGEVAPKLREMDYLEEQDDRDLEDWLGGRS